MFVLGVQCDHTTLTTISVNIPPIYCRPFSSLSLPPSCFPFAHFFWNHQFCAETKGLFSLSTIYFLAFLLSTPHMCELFLGACSGFICYGKIFEESLLLKIKYLLVSMESLLLMSR